MAQQETHEEFEAAKELLKKPKRILISGHLSPDGDSLGSMIALARFLKAAGHDAVATADPKALGKPGFLEGVSDLVPLRRLKNRKFDLFVSVDCAAFERLPPEARPFAEKLPLLVIDHHVTNSAFGTVSIIDAEAAAAGEIVWRFAKWMEWPLDGGAVHGEEEVELAVLEAAQGHEVGHALQEAGLAEGFGIGRGDGIVAGRAEETGERDHRAERIPVRAQVPRDEDPLRLLQQRLRRREIFTCLQLRHEAQY